MAKSRSRQAKKRSFRLDTGLVAGLIGFAILIAVAFGIQRQSSTEVVLDENGEVLIAAEVGAMAPDFELPMMEGGVQKLSDYRGKPVVLTFMHTW